MDLLTRLNNHAAMMAPHQQDRHTGRLLLEARERLVELQNIVTTDHETKDEFIARVTAILNR